jgi:uncharacterized membrane protein
MRNIALMLLVLLVAFAIARITGASAECAGKVGIASLFCFTALGHFAKPAEMLEMLPAWLPARRLIVIAGGGIELAFGIGILMPATSHAAAIAMIVFLFTVAPLNVYSACHRVRFGGHSAGPRYLLVRLPLQASIIAWVWWFGLHICEFH